jgi:GDPmannose 4,6-dehydratase
MKIALVFGSTGQDGSYMCDLLIKKNYKVYGLVRKSATGNTKNLKHIIEDKKVFEKNFFLVRGDLNDHSSIHNLINKIKPNEIYNFADQDHVGWSFAIPSYSLMTTSHSLINILETIKNLNSKIKYFHPLSSNMFGITTFNPQSVYAISKVTCYHLCKLYRNLYNLRIYNTIFYNHESPRRSEEYVTTKIVKHVCEIYQKRRKSLELGDITAKIDWGYAKEYVQYVQKIMQLKKPDEKCFKYVGLDYKKYLKTNKKFLRPTKTSVLVGDTKKIKKVLNFKIEYNLDRIIKTMMDHELKNSK